MAYKRKTREETNQEIENLTREMDRKIESYFESEEALVEHLIFMSQFHSYSMRNMVLIDSQFRGARAVGSFSYWKGKGVSIQKGEKGIKILVPTPVEYFKRDNEWIRVRFATANEKALLKQGKIATQKKLYFKIGHVFEYTQTDAREKGIPVSKVFGQHHKDGQIDQAKEMVEALHRIADHVGFTILQEPHHELGTAKGAAYPYQKEIALNPRNTEFENVTTLIHELAHAKLHTPDVRDTLTVSEREFQAEMVSYVVASRYGIQTEDFSLSYLANWTQGKELKEKEALLQEVKQTSHEFIEIIDRHFHHLEKAQQHTVEYTKDAYESVLAIQEKHGVKSDVIEFNHIAFLERLEKESPEAYWQYLSYSSMVKHEWKHGSLKNVTEPMVMFHGKDWLDCEFRPLGELKKESFEALYHQTITYTVVLPQEPVPICVSGSYAKGEHAHPLYHLKEDRLVSHKHYEQLEKSYSLHGKQESSQTLAHYSQNRPFVHPKEEPQR